MKKKIQLRLMWDGAPTSDTGKADAYANTLRRILPGIRWREIVKGELENEWFVNGVIQDVSQIPKPSVAEIILLALIKHPGLVQHAIPMSTVRLHDKPDQITSSTSWRLTDY